MDAFSANESVSLDKTVEAEGSEFISLDSIWTDQKRSNLQKWIGLNGLNRVCLQFPDQLLGHSVEICQNLQELCPGTSFFILADTTYCPCCVDEIGAEHVQADGLVHFGNACLTKTTGKIKVFYVFFDWDLNLEKLKQEVVQSIPNKDTPLVIFHDTGFYYKSDKISQYLSDYSNLLVAKLAIDCEADILNWTTKSVTDFSNYQCVFIGEDSQSYFNISMSVNCNKFWIFDGKSSKIKEVPPLASSWLRRRYFFIEKCKDAQSLGIVHGTVTSKGHLEISNRIQALAKAQNIRTTIISVGKLNPAKLANFMEIDCFVLIGCPENNSYTSRDFYKPLISVFECELALNPVWREKFPDSYCTDFKEMLQNGKYHTNSNGIEALEVDVSLISGRVRGVQNGTNGTGNGGRSVIPGARQVLMERSAGDALQQRSWRGLEQNLGQDEPALVQQGRSGIPIKYEENPLN